jgi:hypothetical protein
VHWWCNYPLFKLLWRSHMLAAKESSCVGSSVHYGIAEASKNICHLMGLGAYLGQTLGTSRACIKSGNCLRRITTKFPSKNHVSTKLWALHALLYSKNLVSTKEDSFILLLLLLKSIQGLSCGCENFK